MAPNAARCPADNANQSNSCTHKGGNVESVIYYTVTPSESIDAVRYPVRNGAANKPSPALWACRKPEGSFKTRWARWSRGNLRSKYVEQGIAFILRPEARILRLDSLADGEKLLPYRSKDEFSDEAAAHELEMIRILEEKHANPEMVEFYREIAGDHSIVDWTLLSQDYDGLEASDDYVSSSGFCHDYRNFKDWDVGSLVLFRTNVIQAQIRIDDSNRKVLADDEALLRALAG